MLSLFLKDVMSFFERLKSFLETCYIFLPNPNMFLLSYSERLSFVKVKGCYKTICKDDMGGIWGIRWWKIHYSVYISSLLIFCYLAYSKKFMQTFSDISFIFHLYAGRIRMYPAYLCHTIINLLNSYHESHENTNH